MKNKEKSVIIEYEHYFYFYFKQYEIYHPDKKGSIQRMNGNL